MMHFALPPNPPALMAMAVPAGEGEMLERVDAIGWHESDYDELLDASDAGAWAPEDFGACIAAESEFRCQSRNASGARGLTQMMPATLASLGWQPGNAFHDMALGDFCRAPLFVQLDFAYRYFQGWRQRFRLTRWRTMAQLFLANFLPADLPYAQRPGFVLAEDQGRRARVWEANRTMDRNRNGAITVAELEAFLLEATTGRAREPFRAFLEGIARARLRKDYPDSEPTDRADLGLRDVRDLRQLRHALAAHGLDAGPVEGLSGPAPRRALEVFQAQRGLLVDGIAGVFTWNALSSPMPPS